MIYSRNVLIINGSICNSLTGQYEYIWRCRGRSNVLSTYLNVSIMRDIGQTVAGLDTIVDTPCLTKLLKIHWMGQRKRNPHYASDKSPRVFSHHARHTLISTRQIRITKFRYLVSHCQQRCLGNICNWIDDMQSNFADKKIFHAKYFMV